MINQLVEKMLSILINNENNHGLHSDMKLKMLAAAARFSKKGLMLVFFFQSSELWLCDGSFCLQQPITVRDMMYLRNK